MMGSKAHQGKVDIREDEEQKVKLEQCLELLVSAGYYRAQIHGLPSFDKIVGGMAWCIESCCIDLDVDLLYDDSLTIGQKISLTERLISVLPAMQCPHLVQPHQVQGLDAVHILPVMQWLVKEALAKRAQYGSVSQAVAALHFKNSYPTTTINRPAHLLQSLTAIQCRYESVRRWNVSSDGAAFSAEQRVYATLLEYGVDNPADVLAALNKAGQQMSTEEEWRQLLKYFQRIHHDTSDEECSLLSAAIAKLPQQMALPKQSFGSLQEQEVALQTQVSALQEQMLQEESSVQQLQTAVKEAGQRVKDTTGRIEKLRTDTAVSGSLSELRHLVEEAESIKKREHQYKDQCRKFAANLQENIRSMEEDCSNSNASVPPELLSLVQQERDKCARIRDSAAVSARHLAQLRRAWDDVPGRAELAQYRHRLTELNDLVMSSERETHQFYTMYNTLLESKAAMEKHLTILNDVLDNIQHSTKTAQSSTQLLAQVDAVLRDVQHNKTKVCNERSVEDTSRTSVTGKLSSLQETARLYTRTAHALAHQLNKNQQLSEFCPPQTTSVT